jgi:hypothetical protein
MLTDFAAIQRVRGDLSDTIQSASGLVTRRVYFAGCYVKSTRRWKMQVKDTLLQIKRALKRHAILRQYRHAAKQQCEAEPKTPFPDINRFPRKDKGLSVPFTSTRECSAFSPSAPVLQEIMNDCERRQRDEEPNPI